MEIHWIDGNNKDRLELELTVEVYKDENGEYHIVGECDPFEITPNCGIGGEGNVHTLRNPYCFTMKNVNDDLNNYILGVDTELDRLVNYNNKSMSVELHSNNKSEVDNIATLKHKIKYCKNPLQKLNMEREMGRLIREMGRR